MHYAQVAKQVQLLFEPVDLHDIVVDVMKMIADHHHQHHLEYHDVLLDLDHQRAMWVQATTRDLILERLGPIR
ncbi:hypothetical protein D3C80_1639010 [compost metagenome]